MACNQERLMALPIRGAYKQQLFEFCSDPANQSACMLLCDSSDEQIIDTINQIEGQLADWSQNGPPPELTQVASQIDPGMAMEAEAALTSPAAKQMSAQFLATQNPAPPPAPGGLANLPAGQMAEVPEPMDMQPRGYSRGGLASLGRYGDTNMAHVANGEMVVPNSVLRQPGMRDQVRGMMITAGTNPDRYTVGSTRMSVNPRTGQPEFFSLGGILGGVIGAVALGPVGLGLSMAAGAGIGAAAGNFLETGDLFSSAMMGFGAYSLAGSSFAQGLFNDTSAALAGDAATAAGSAAIESGAEFAAFDAVPDALMFAPETATGASSVAYGMPAQQTGIGGLFNNIFGSDTQAGQVAGAGQEVANTNDKSWWGSLSTPQKLGVGAGAGILALGFMEGQPENTSFDELNSMATRASYNPELQAYYKCVGSGRTDCVKPDGAYLPPPQLQMAGVSGPISGTGAGQTFHNPQVSYPVYSNPVITQGGQRITGSVAQAAHGGHVRGPGTATSDSIPAYLSDGEFVMTTDAVRGAGDGDLERGAARLYALMNRFENQRA